MTRRLAAQGLAGPEQAESLLSVASALAQGVATPGEGLALDALHDWLSGGRRAQPVSHGLPQSLGWYRRGFSAAVWAST
ncbi:hypothetical protein [Streptomyces sp. NPDC002159]